MVVMATAVAGTTKLTIEAGMSELQSTKAGLTVSDDMLIKLNYCASYGFFSEAWCTQFQ